MKKENKKKEVVINKSYLREFKKFYDKHDFIEPCRPSERATVLFSFDAVKITAMLLSIGIPEQMIEAMKLLAEGNTYLEVARVYEVSTDTIKKWCNRAYKTVINAINDIA